MDAEIRALLSGPPAQELAAEDEEALKRLTEVIRKADHYRNVYLHVPEEEQLKEHGLDYAALAHLRSRLAAPRTVTMEWLTHWREEFETFPHTHECTIIRLLNDLGISVEEPK